MATTSMRAQDHEGFISLDVEPCVLVNRTDEVEQPNYDTTTVNVEVDYLPLYFAALNGDWESARSFIGYCPNAVTARIFTQSMTALHVAAREGRSDFVEKLVAHELMSQKALAIQDCLGRTALHYAAMNSTKSAVKAMVNKNPNLTQVMDVNGWTPLFCAASWGTKEVVCYLCSKTTDHAPASPFSGQWAARLICTVTRAGFHDVAIDLVLRYPHLATARDGKYSVLRVLAEMPSAFWSGSRLGFLGSLAYKCGYAAVRDEAEVPGENSRDLVERPISTAFRRILFRTMKILVPACHWEKVYDKIMTLEQAKGLVKLVCEEVSRMNYSQIEEFFKESSILTTAACYGIEEIVTLCCLQYFPYLIWLTTIDEKTILHVAVEHRQKRIFNLLKKRLKKNARISGIVKLGTNILHAVAKWPPPSRLNSIDSSALQLMQSEVQWFEDVNGIVPPSYKEERNAENQTALDVFMKDHTQLAKDAEKWMKETSNYCILVATIVTTVAFAAAFTVPGGTNSDKGTPIFLKRESFIVFAISDALALFFSSSSIILFLSILASRSSAKDLKWSRTLVPMLANAIVSLFLAITTMVFAFGSALWIILDGRLRLISFAITLLCLGPLLVFTLSQLPLISHVFYWHYAVAAMIASGFTGTMPSQQ